MTLLSVGHKETLITVRYLGLPFMSSLEGLDTFIYSEVPYILIQKGYDPNLTTVAGDPDGLALISGEKFASSTFFSLPASRWRLQRNAIYNRSPYLPTSVWPNV